MIKHIPPRLLFIAYVVLMSLGGCNRSSDTNTNGNAENQESLQEAAFANDEHQRAAEHYANYCSGCHGQQLEAFVDRDWQYGDSREDIFTAIKQGIPEDGMPSFAETFSDEEIEGLVSYLKEGMENVDQYSFEEESLPDTIRSEELSFTLDTVVSGLEIIWGMAFLPDGEMLVTEKTGNLYRLDRNKNLQRVEGTPEVVAEGQGGMLDVALHPDFRQNKTIYLSYSAPKEGGLATTAIMRAVLEGNRLRNSRVIFEAQPFLDTRHHYGSRLAFSQDGLLYFTVGDRGQHANELPQKLDNHVGKIHRIREDGSIPDDNPFVNRQDTKPTIFSYGHRNQQGLVIHPENGELWQHEHGPKGGDELHKVDKSANYGWPVITYGIDYDGSIISDKTEQEGMEQPLHYWVPSIAPSGMAFVSGDRYPGWEGDLLIGSLRFQYLNRCKMEGNEVVGEEKLLQNIGRVRDVKMGPDGYMYVSVEDPGSIYRLVPVE